MKLKTPLLSLIVLFFFSQTLYAFKISLYEVKIPVASQSESDRDSAIKKGFGETIVRITGNANALQNGTARAALPEGKNYIQEFEYLTEDKQSWLRLKFDAPAIKTLIREAHLSVWSENRPLILPVVVVQNDKDVTILDNSLTHEFAKQMKLTSDLKGLPFLFPIMDPKELDKIQIDDIRNLSLKPLQDFSQSYHPDAILIGSVDAKTQQSRWLLKTNDGQWQWELKGDYTATTQALFAKILSFLEKKEVKSVEGEPEVVRLTLTIKGINENDDYENVISSVKNLGFIKNFEIENVLSDAIVVHLALDGTKEMLMDELADEAHLRLENNSDGALTYLWLR